MELMLRMLKTLFPRGRAWRLPDYWLALLGSFARAMDDAKNWIKNIKDQRHPRSSSEALDDWRQVMGIAPNRDLSEQQWRDRLEAFDVAKGGQDLQYINRILQIVYPHCWIERVPTNDVLGHRDSRCGLARCSGGEIMDNDGNIIGSVRFIYYVKGIAMKSEEADMADLVARLCPAHMQAIWSVEFLNEEVFHARASTSRR